MSTLPQLPTALALLLSILISAGTAAARQVAVPAREEQPQRRVSGLVVDRSGSVLPRVRVAILNPGGGKVAEVYTNGRGEFSLELPEGTYSLRAELAGFAPLEDYRLDVTASSPPLALTLEIPIPGEQIVVTATRSAAPLSQVGSGITVISGSELQTSGAPNLTEALRRVTGAAVVQSGATGQLTSLFMRGGESDYTRIQIDGITVNEPGGSYNLAALSNAAIERIEVVRGPQSALSGSDAMSGTIQIFTQQGATEGLRPAPGLFVEGGSYSTTNLGASLRGRDERLDYFASFSRIDTDNHMQNGSFNNGTAAANVGIHPSAAWEMRMIFRSDAGRAGVPGPWAFRPPDPDEYYRHRNLAGGVTLRHHPSSRWSHSLSYTIHDSRQFSEDPSDSGSFIPTFGGRVAPLPAYDFAYQFLNRTRRQRAQYQNDVTLPGGHLFTVGAEYEHESGLVGDPRQNPLRATRNNLGGYLQDQWAFQNRVFTAIGVRLEHNDSFGFFAAPRASVAWHARSGTGGGFWGLTKLKGNFGLGIKEPTLVESFSESPFFKGNPDLRAERASSFDAGLEQQFGRGAGALEVSLFHNQFRDQIGFAITDYQTFEGSFFNLARSRARGVEVFMNFCIPWDLEIGGGYTFLDSKVLENPDPADPVFAEGKQLFRRPRHAGFADLKWKPGPWTLGASGLFVGGRLDSDFSGLELTRNPGYGILNLTLSYRFGESSCLFVAVNNALNRNYMEALGYPALPAHFRAGVRAGF